MPLKKSHIHKGLTEPEKVADEIAHHVVELLGKTRPIARIRGSRIISAVIGLMGITMFILGIQQIFGFLSPKELIAYGLVLLTISGTLLSRLN